MSDDRGPVVHQHLLMRALIALRHENGLTQQQVARDLDWSHAKMMRYENCQQVLPRAELDALLVEYGVASAPLARDLRALGEAARRPVWWAPYRCLLTADQRIYFGLEAGADTIRQVATYVLPDLLQTRDYARCIAAARAEPWQVHSLVEMVMRRQAALGSRSSRPRQRYLLSEAVLRIHVGVEVDPSIMVRQLHHLVEAAAAPEVQIRVLPHAHGEHLALVYGLFTLVGFGEVGLEEVFHAQSGHMSLLTSKKSDVGPYPGAFEEAWELALPEDASVRLISDRRAHLDAAHAELR
ncbi:helix-turn-helix transcriptional regulator [Nocardiopsis sp. NPDC006139]|uniref:helix-turn-helix domain-containing protein n=1 Tax=Nocardiopsis sp. NPDC006139 TaxID=3154578 RepID=UPI0033ACFFF4